ncbi:DNA polymerase III subunit gamma/tau [Desulforhopalus singaporensis]|uniref:DNA polymerase III subunit gamma/tau n=1 Tax=Desulforhopalus singaporensis TaxID=91360 RepID=A0A1H0NV21_9BACT|nr:DNA polymerase III subunit gamma/tau [Desulforhopalus singaporensis]SDO96551.1 DNA polymerase III, tau subunit [Desulforhopalus singaporensis]
MSYLVLARKFRPQRFSQIVGQRPVVKTLQNSIDRNRIAHAILFSGVRGVGKTTLARIMAKAINCSSTQPDKPCDECSSCREIRKGNFIDLYEIDGASNRGIQEIRELKEKLRFLPTSAKFKVIIIDEVHMLTTEAFNALLKTLEEPPDHVYFMFATTEIHKIPVTILSRCQQYELKRVPAKELYEHFGKLAEMEGYRIEPEALSLIVREAAGSVRDGLSLLDQMFSFGEQEIKVEDVVEVLGLVDREILMNLSRALLHGDKKETFLSLEKVFEFGTDIKRFMVDLLDHFRNLLFCKINGCSHLIDLPQEDLNDLTELASDYSAETIHLKLSLLMAAAEELKFSTLPRLSLETSFFKIIETSNIVPISSLLGQLDQFLSNLPTGGETPNPIAPPPQEAARQSKKNGNEKKTAEQPAPSEQPVPPAAAQQPSAGTAEPTQEQSQQQQPKPSPDAGKIKIHSHEKEIRKEWPRFIEYVRDRKIWMAKDLQRADSAKEDAEGILHITYSDPHNCSLLKQKENLNLLTEFALDFFQKQLKVRITVPKTEEATDVNGEDSPHKKRQQLANDPIVIMAADIFNGEIGDIRIGPRSR